MPILVLVLLLAIPLVELAIIIKVGGMIGVLPTIGLLLGMGVLGTIVLRHQGITVLRNAEAALQAGRMPVDTALDGIGLMLAGALLLLPGLVSDVLGLLLLVPTIRRLLIRWIFGAVLRSGAVRVDTMTIRRGRRPPGAEGRPGGPVVIDGEYERLDDDDKPDIGRPRR